MRLTPLGVPRNAVPLVIGELWIFTSGRALMEKYECGMCEYTYDPAIGDPARGIPPGTSFDDLPNDWKCPKCNAGKNMFTEA
jgi:rubredoxin